MSYPQACLGCERRDAEIARLREAQKPPHNPEHRLHSKAWRTGSNGAAVNLWSCDDCNDSWFEAVGPKS